MTKPLVLLATGDVAPRRDAFPTMFDGVREALGAGDLVFGQLETCISERGTPSPHAKLAMRTGLDAAPAIAGAGYDVMSFAGNHCLDWGRDAFTDTLSAMDAAGVRLCGAGQTLAQARQPVILDRNGVRIAFLAYSSILPQGYWAQADRPGCAPMRGLTLYEQVETDQPGTPARVHTFPHRADLAALRRDVRDARRQADVVALSIHWGIHFVHGEIADYQRDIAHAAIDDGCDVILGHHPHMLKGIEVYKGRPIFYSLGNFAIEQPQAFDPDILKSESFRDLMALNPAIDPMRLFVGPPDSQKSMIASLTFGPGGLERAAFIPVQISDGSEPRALTPNDPDFGAILGYVRTISHEQGLDTVFGISGGEVVIESLAEGQ